ncbi:peptidase inhibitor family I36 protein [Streptomyces sp. CC224B]|uniref:peptidase inhibitor family I36 protein n=1 Tax=Streptomyces sp. CC224B TaxID=3044571 RepID=UPI0024A806B6|nr:peptidase inhibitor family I36 protein [Streptomyces sp. CC224B]
MRTKTRIALAGSVVALGAGLVTAPATLSATAASPASERTAQANSDIGAAAATMAGECPAGYACFWPHAEFRGNRGKVEGNNRNFRRLHNAARSCGNKGWEDCISSIANNGRQCTVYFYDKRDYKKGAPWHSLSRGHKVGNFARDYNDPAFNDKISSNKWCAS